MPHIALYFFCSNAADTRNHASHIIRSLLSQLITKIRSLIRHLMPTYEVQGSRILSENSIELLWSMFLAAISTSDTPRVLCLMDGLDECNAISTKTFLNEAIRPRPSGRLNLLIVSREHPTWIRDSLGAWSRIRLDPDAKDDVQDSWSAYIFTRTEELACSVVKRCSQSSLGKSDPH